MTLLAPTPNGSAIASRRARLAGRPWALAAVLWSLGYAVVNATAALPANPQLWWQVRQGELTLSTGQAVLTHSWSWTAGDIPWIPNSWGWGTLLALAYRGAGLPGVVVFVLLAQLGVLAIAWHVLGRLGLGAGPLRLGVLVLLSLSMAGWADGQSELADYLAILGFAAVCLSRRLRALAVLPRRAVMAAAAFALAAAWENLHLGGLVAILAFAAVAVLVDGLSRGALLVALAAALGILVTPSGAAGIAKSLATASISRAEHYAAWEPLFAAPTGYNYEPAVLALVIGATAVVLASCRRDGVGVCVVVLAAASTCLVVRAGSDLVMFSVLVGARALAPSRPPLLRRMPRMPRMPQMQGMPRMRMPRRAGPVVLLAAAAWAMVAAIVAGASLVPPWRLTGVDPADLAAIPSGARVFSTIGGSDVIDTLRPDLEVTMDSRNDLYPVAQFEYDKALWTTGVAGAPDYFADNGVTAVFLPGAPAREMRTRLATTLLAAGWHRSLGVHALVLLSPRLRAGAAGRGA